MEKKWVTMHAFCGYQIQILNGAEDGDRMDYRILDRWKYIQRSRPLLMQ